MNSLQDLNFYSNTGVAYTDDRAFAITFSNAVPVNQTVSVAEGQTHTIKTGTDITYLLSANSVTYTINVATVAGTTVTWPNALPSLVTVSNVAGVYTVSNISSATVWDQIKSPIVIMPRDRDTNWSYDCKIGYGGNANVKSWSTAVTVSGNPEISGVSTMGYIEDQAVGMSGTPQIIDTETTGTYSMTITPNTASAVRRITSNSTLGGSATFNSSTRVLTITGTQTQANAHLQSLTLTPEPDYAQPFSFAYLLTNPVSGITSGVTQAISVINTDTDYTNMDLTRYYTENSVDLLFATNLPQITESGTTFSMSFRLYDALGVISLGESFSAPAGWNASTQTYTYTGTKAQCNTILSQMRFLPNKGQYGNSEIEYKEYIDGTLSRTTTFAIQGSALANYISGGTGTFTVDENTRTNAWGQFTIAPHYSDNFAIAIQSQISGSTSTTMTWFETATAGWSTNGVWPNLDSIYKNYSAPSSVTAYLNNLAELATIYISLRLDNTTDFDLVQTLGIGSTYTGGSFSGGTTYTATRTVDITPYPTKSVVTNSYNYTENTFANLVLAVADNDVRSDITYTVDLGHVSPFINSSNVGRFYVNNVAYAWGSNVSITATKAQLNQMQWKYDPSVDYTGNVTIKRSQTKVKGNVSVSQGSNVLSVINTATNLEFMYPYTDTSYFGNIDISGGGPNSLSAINSASNANIPAAAKHAANISNPRGDNASFRANIGEFAPLSFRTIGTTTSPYTQAASIFRVDDGATLSANAVAFGGNVSNDVAKDLTGRSYTVAVTDLNNHNPEWYYNTTQQLTTGTYLGMPVQVFTANSTVILGPDNGLEIGNFLRDLTIKGTETGLIKLSTTVTRTSNKGTRTLFSGNTCNIRIQPVPGATYQGGSTLWSGSSITYDGYPYTNPVNLSTLGNINSPYYGKVAGTQDFYLVTSNVSLGNVAYINSFANVPGVYEVYANTEINLRSNAYITTTWNNGLNNTANLATVQVNANVVYIAANTADSYENGGYSDWYLPGESEVLAMTSNYVGPGNALYQLPYQSGGTDIRYWSSTHLNSRIYLGVQALPQYFNWRWTGTDFNSILFGNNGTVVPVRRQYIEY